MKNLRYWIIIAAAAVVIIASVRHERGDSKKDIRIIDLEYQVARDSLMIDSLKDRTIESGWYEAKFDQSVDELGKAD